MISLLITQLGTKHIQYSQIPLINSCRYLDSIHYYWNAQFAIMSAGCNFHPSEIAQSTAFVWQWQEPVNNTRLQPLFTAIRAACYVIISTSVDVKRNQHVTRLRTSSDCRFVKTWILQSEPTLHQCVHLHLPHKMHTICIMPHCHCQWHITAVFVLSLSPILLSATKLSFGERKTIEKLCSLKQFSIQWY